MPHFELLTGVLGNAKNEDVSAHLDGLVVLFFQGFGFRANNSQVRRFGLNDVLDISNKKLFYCGGIDHNTSK